MTRFNASHSTQFFKTWPVVQQQILGSGKLIKPMSINKKLLLKPAAVIGLLMVKFLLLALLMEQFWLKTKQELNYSQLTRVSKQFGVQLSALRNSIQLIIFWQLDLGTPSFQSIKSQEANNINKLEVIRIQALILVAFLSSQLVNT